MVEITQRTFQGRYLLKPSQQLNALFVGCLARAQKKNPGVQLHAVVVMSNHFHLLASFNSVETMAGFMGHLKTNLSKEVARLHDWPGSLWDGRYKSVPVSDEPAAQISRLRYLLSQGVKEGLVLSAEDWPGIHPARPLRTRSPMKGKWINRTKLCIARLCGKKVTEADFSEDQEVSLTPIPALRTRSYRNFAKEVANLVADIEKEALSEHRRRGSAPAGLAAILGRDPHHRPEHLPHSPQPRFHAASSLVRQRLLDGFREFLLAYRAAAEKLIAGETQVEFPPNCFPPRLPATAPVKV